MDNIPCQLSVSVSVTDSGYRHRHCFTDTDTVCDGRAVRGFFGNLYRDRQEFHGHKGIKNWK